MRFPKATLGLAAVALALTAIPITQLGGEVVAPEREKNYDEDTGACQARGNEVRAAAQVLDLEPWHTAGNNAVNSL